MNPIIKVDRSKAVPVYTVRKILTDAQTTACKGKFMDESNYPVILKEDGDVYTEDGELLVRFRKNVLSKKAIDDAYEAMKVFVRNVTTNRGYASGSEKGLATGQKNPVRSNIMGYFDKWSISQRSTFKRSGIKAPGKCRYCTFNVKFPKDWEKIVPLIKEIDQQYKKLCPKEHADQLKAANLTPFHIPGTAFSTLTTNLNFRTAAHQDTGDWPTGFGNLAVIERGKHYEGAYTGFPQYGVAADCRTGDFLAMDVHQVHGNTPKNPKEDDSIRLSLVNYLRQNIVKNCQHEQLYNPQKLENRIQTWRKSQHKTAKRPGYRGLKKPKALRHTRKLKKTTRIEPIEHAS